MTPEEPSRSARGQATARRVATNLLFSGAGQVWSVILTVITIPIVVHGLGVSAYGVFVLGSLLMGYVGFLDLGLSSAVVRSLAVHYLAGDDDRLTRLVGTALSLLLGLGVIGAIAIAAAAPVVVRSVLHIGPSLQGDAVFVLDLAAIGFGLNMCLSLFGAVPQGLQRQDLFTVRSFILTTATALGQILAVKLGGGLRWVAGITIAVNVLSLAVFVIVSRQLLPQVSFRPRLDRWAIRELSSFGLFRFLNQISAQVVFQLDRLIVAAFLPIRAVTYYSVPLSIAQRFTVVQFMFSGAYFPAASELHAKQDVERLRRLYLSSMKVSVVMVLPLVVLVAGFAQPLLATWLSPTFAAESTNVLAVLAVAYGFATVIGVPGLASDATGHIRWTTAFAIASAIINLTLTLILVPRLGPVGAALALLLNSATQGMLFIYVVQRWFVGVSLGRVLRDVLLRPAIAAAGLALYTWLLTPHLHSFAAVVAATALGVLLYLAMTVALGVWDPTELRLAQAMLGAFRHNG